MPKLMWLGLGLLTAGVISGICEQVFYGGRLDAGGVLQESFFLPLSFLLVFLGGLLIVVSAARYLVLRIRRLNG